MICVCGERFTQCRNIVAHFFKEIITIRFAQETFINVENSVCVCVSE